jgi:Icc-related predicted phosphoesterase
MKVLSISDKLETALMDEDALARYPKVDIIFSCGDLAPEYLSHLKRIFNAPLYYVRGNHDIRYQMKPPVGCMDINGKLVQYKGLRILGLEGSRWYNGGPAQYTETQMRKNVRQLRAKIWWEKGIDMVITHAPPRHIHDAEDLCHRGFKVFRRLIGRYQPAYFIHGHIHASFADSEERITIVNRTQVINTYGHFYFEVTGYGVTYEAKKKLGQLY